MLFKFNSHFNSDLNTNSIQISILIYILIPFMLLFILIRVHFISNLSSPFSLNFYIRLSKGSFHVIFHYMSFLMFFLGTWD